MDERRCAVVRGWEFLDLVARAIVLAECQISNLRFQFEWHLKFQTRIGIESIQMSAKNPCRPFRKSGEVLPEIVRAPSCLRNDSLPFHLSGAGQ